MTTLFENLKNILINEEIDEKDEIVLPFIKINLLTEEVHALIDTGAQASLIKESIIMKNKRIWDKNIIKINKLDLLAANKRKITTIQYLINLKVYIENEEYEASLLIVPGLEFEIIIGLDMIEKWEMIINGKERSIILKENRIIPWVNNLLINENNEVYNMNNNNNDIVFNNSKILEDKIEKIEMQEEYRGFKDRISELIKKYDCLINDEPGLAMKYVHTLEVNENNTFNVKNYPIPYAMRNKVKEEIKKMLKNNIIEMARTPYINPIVIVKKKSGEIRLCLDARKINEITKPQFESPQSIDSLLGRINSKTIFSKLDLKSSFWLIPLHENSRKFTGFSVDGEIFQFKVVPFGLSTSCAALVRAMQKILNIYDEFCVHYVDDILIFSENLQEHFIHLEKVLQTLANNNMKLSLEKCEFLRTDVTYLGYKINKNGVQINEDRIETIKNFPRPKNLKTLRGFLGVLNYYKKFVPNYSELVIPLVELLRKNIKWNWDERREKAFIKIKENFYKELLLKHPNFDLEFILRTDASDYAIAAELVQIMNQEDEPICFISRILKPCEIKYTVSEKEMLAIVFAVNKLKYYLMGKKFIIETDNSALTFMKKKIFLNNRLYRWALFLQEFEFEIKHKSGKTNVTADFLSRKDILERQKPNQIILAYQNLCQNEGLFTMDNIKEIQNHDEIKGIRNKIQEDKQELKGFVIKDNILIKQIGDKELIVITKEMAQRIIKIIHEHYGHIGIKKTWLIFRECFYIKKDYNLVIEYIHNCEKCLIMKYKNYHNINEVKTIMTQNKLDIVAIDYLGNLIVSENGYKHILIMVDLFSKYVKLYPTRKCNAKHVILSIKKFTEEIGKPKIILLDNATYFHNKKLIKYVQSKDIKLSFTSIRHPQGNPAERYIREVVTYLRILTSEKHDAWAKYMNVIENFINNVPNTLTEISPVTIVKNTTPIRPWNKEEYKVDTKDLISNIKQKVEKKQKRFLQKQNKAIKANKNKIYKIGDFVIVKNLMQANKRKKICAKLLQPYIGPYKVSKVLNPCTYEISDIANQKKKGQYHISDMYPWNNKIELNK